MVQFSRASLGCVEGIQISEIDGVNVVVGTVEFGIGGQDRGFGTDVSGEAGTEVDFGDLLLGVGWEVELVVEDFWWVGSAHQAEIASVGACS